MQCNRILSLNIINQETNQILSKLDLSPYFRSSDINFESVNEQMIIFSEIDNKILRVTLNNANEIEELVSIGTFGYKLETFHKIANTYAAHNHGVYIQARSPKNETVLLHYDFVFNVFRHPLKSIIPIFKTNPDDPLIIRTASLAVFELLLTIDPIKANTFEFIYCPSFNELKIQDR